MIAARERGNHPTRMAFVMFRQIAASTGSAHGFSDDLEW